VRAFHLDAAVREVCNWVEEGRERGGRPDGTCAFFADPLASAPRMLSRIRRDSSSSFPLFQTLSQ